MPWRQKERAVKEKRTIEATKKNLMGPAGKLGKIVKILGHPIVRQGGGYCDISYLEDPYEDFKEEEYGTTASGQRGPFIGTDSDELPEMDDDYVYLEGYAFDGLSRGMHIEVQYFKDNQKLTVTYKGYLVYKEVAGELESYAPFIEWEQMVDRLYTSAKSNEKGFKEAQELQIAQQVSDTKDTFWKRLRMRWGL